MAIPRNAKLRPRARRQKGILKEAEWIVDRSTAESEAFLLHCYTLSFRDRRLRRYILKHAHVYRERRLASAHRMIAEFACTLGQAVAVGLARGIDNQPIR